MIRENKLCDWACNLCLLFIFVERKTELLGFKRDIGVSGDTFITSNSCPRLHVC